MNFSVKDWSYGVELEYGDCYRFGELPKGASWNDKDNTVVSSTGIANDPSGKLYAFGGEINTKPTDTISEQIQHIRDINEALNPRFSINYRSNLHIHIRVPGLKDDLEAVKKLLRYVDTYQQEAFDIVEHIPKPDPNRMTDQEYKGALKRYKRRQKSHQYKMPEKRVAAMLGATTTQEFFEEHAPLTEKGRMWYFAPRAGINLRQLWEETNTIEFRHFPGTSNLNEMNSCIRWCEDFLNAALNQDDVRPLDLKDNGYQFPKFQTYNFKMEEIYQWTNFDKNSRGVVKKRLQALRDVINIDDVLNVSYLDIYDAMLKLKEAGV